MKRKIPIAPTGYTLVKILGKGAFKETYEAVNNKTGERLALKRYRKGRRGWIDPRDLTVNFLRPDLRHENLLPAFWINEEWIAEPLLSNILSDFLPATNRLKNKEFLSVAIGLLRGLEHLHNCGIIHGDLKPQNMGLHDKTPVLSDFGTASIYASTNRTLRDYPGTIRTRPPELHRKDTSPTTQSDTWMMAATLLALRTGSYPFITEAQIISDPTRSNVKTLTGQAIKEGERHLHQRIHSKIDSLWLARLLSNSLRFDPAKRLTASEILSCLVRRKSAPYRILGIWEKLRRLSHKVRFQNDLPALFKLADHLAVLTYFDGITLIEEHLLEGLADSDPILNLLSFRALAPGAVLGIFNPQDFIFKKVTKNASATGRVLAAILPLLASPKKLKNKDLPVYISNDLSEMQFLGEGDIKPIVFTKLSARKAREEVLFILNSWIRKRSSLTLNAKNFSSNGNYEYKAELALERD